ncbi:MAG: mannose-1-phosphate guanylyltransferase [Planctomycetaceae bacterium]|jgi:mannose-1-phosphate guanylyltransferase|nr:mannose-1-phosphate guanylyltransferase [Planctomycetaceae bacterium]
MLYAVIMAGGQGTRLWPESRKERPKQFLTFHKERPLLQNAAESLDGLIPRERVIVVTGQTLESLVVETLPWLRHENILTEPIARNTAPCLGLAAVHLLKNDPDAIMAVLPSDHVIEPYSAFCDTIHFAAEIVEESPERLVTITVKPTFPSAAYGYIECATKLDSPVCQKWSNFMDAFHVIRFREKPNRETAEKFLQSDKFGWNAGIFVWKAQRILDLINQYQPDLGYRLDNIANAWNTNGYAEVLQSEFRQMESISIDYAVLEKAGSLVAVEARFFWDDVGSWSALDRLNRGKHDEEKNLVINCQMTTKDSRNNIVKGSDPKRPIVLVGVENMIIIQSEHGLLIANKNSDEEKIRNAISENESRSEKRL